MSLVQFVARQARTAALERNPGLRERAARALTVRTGDVTHYQAWKAVKAENIATYRTWVFHGDTNTLTKESR